MAKQKTSEAMFGAGCFWGVEEAFRNTRGVLETEVGYSGGTTEQPTYEDVCTDRTGHAEVVRVIFDPSIISYDGLLEVFWRCHDPTQLNRQGPDVGTQYRSAIFTFSDEQHNSAVHSRSSQEKKLGKKISTVVEPARTFWKAEEYHQNYLLKRGRNMCH